MKRIPGLTYSSPVKFRPGQKVALAVIPPVLSVLLKGWMACCRTEVRGEDHWRQGIDTHGKVLIGLWHEAMGLAVWHYRNTGFHTLTSYSYDGELAARLVGHFGVLALRGSSSRGGPEAVRSMSLAMQHVKAIGLTLDGPRGPRRVAKPGIAMLSIRTHTPIIPHALAVYPAWRLNSWDRFPIPKPFARLVSAYGPPIMPPDEVSPGAIESLRQQTQDALNALHDQLDTEFSEPPGRQA